MTARLDCFGGHERHLGRRRSRGHEQVRCWSLPGHGRRQRDAGEHRFGVGGLGDRGDDQADRPTRSGRFLGRRCGRDRLVVGDDDGLVDVLPEESAGATGGEQLADLGHELVGEWRSGTVDGRGRGVRITLRMWELIYC